MAICAAEFCTDWTFFWGGGFLGHTKQQRVAVVKPTNHKSVKRHGSGVRCEAGKQVFDGSRMTGLCCNCGLRRTVCCG